MVGVQTSLQPFIMQRAQVFVVEIIRYWDEFPVPLVPSSGLVATDQENGMAAWIKCEQNSDIRGGARSKLLHVVVPGPLDRIDQRATFTGSTDSENPNG